MTMTFLRPDGEILSSHQHQPGQRYGDPAMAMTGFALLTIRGHKYSIQ
jgi:hypothetical protein